MEKKYTGVLCGKTKFFIKNSAAIKDCSILEKTCSRIKFSQYS